jgi:glycosyltransferase involved in cell wall biosynthesis
LKIIGICLVRNDDRFLNQVLSGVVDFCDELIVAENRSRDKTSEIAQKWAAEYDHIHFHRIADPSESQELIRKYFAQDVWMFAVDGDEIYEADKLAVLRKQLEEGRFSDAWQVLGKALHCSEFDEASLRATGYLARPSRSMTKLYNFSKIDDWVGATTERLHGGQIIFKAGCSEIKDQSESELNWDDAVFRCLHMVFVKRSSMQSDASIARPNIAEKIAFSKFEKIRYRIMQFFGKEPESKTKQTTYMRGDPVTLSVSSFIDPKNLVS